MLRRFIPITTAVLLLSLGLLALMVAGCREANETTERSEEPLGAVETTETVQAQVDALVESYLDLRRVLADDRSEGLSEGLAGIRRAAQSLADADDAQVQAHAETIAERAAAGPNELDDVREAFKGISAALIELVKVRPPSEAVADTLYVAYCPMAKASWLQTAEAVSNPYMGQKMLTCGEIQETIRTVSS